MPNPYQFIARHADVDFTQQHLCFVQQRLAVAESDVAFYRQQTMRWRNEQNQAIGAALLDLMNSGISHRRYLKFVQANQL